jgi:hypothetical protein
MTTKEYLELELSKPIYNQERVKKIKEVVERKTLTLKEWKRIAMFIPKDEYLGSEILNEDCVEVIEYIGGSIIQMSNDGHFSYKNKRSKDIDEVEDYVWYDIVEKLWCEDCKKS